MRRMRVYAAIMLLCMAFAAAPRAEDGTPSAPIRQLYGELLQIMQNADELGYEGRYARLAPTIEAVYNLPLITRLATGKRWDGFSDADKQALVAAVSRLTISTYAARFDGYSGERFEVYGEEPAQKNTALVKTALIKSNGEPVQLNYLMHHAKSGWRIADVHLNGVISEVGMRRSEYGALISQGGVAGLVGAIDKQIASLERAAN